MMEFYITNTEKVYERGEPVIRLYGRDEEGDAQTATVTGYNPYFYIRTSEADEHNPMDYEEVVGFAETEFEGIKGANLTKVVLSKPDVSDLTEVFEKTWQADMTYTNQFRKDLDVKTGVRIPSSRCDVSDVEPVEMDEPTRVVTVDIETDDRGAGFPDPGEARILSIVAHDSFDDEYVGFIDLSGRGFETAFDPEVPPEEIEHPNDLGLDEVDQLLFEPDEASMLKEFGKWLGDVDPDLLTGWNSGDAAHDGFDWPHLIARMKTETSSASRLSREGDVWVNDYKETPHIKGRTPYDLMDAWESTKFTDPRSLSLDWAAHVELDDAKIEHENIGYYDLYCEDTTKFLNYNGKDTRLTVEVEDEANILGFKKRLRDIIGLDYEDTADANQFVEMMIRRELDEAGLIGPTADPPEDSGSYEGAYVFPAFNGIEKNVIGKDLESLYPMCIWMLNASPETKIDKDVAEAKGIPYIEAANGVCFRQDEDGVMKRLVDWALTLKAEYKEKRNNATAGTDERAAWAERYNVAKTIVNAVYGVIGWDKFFLYDEEIAAAVTLTGQVVIKATANHINENTVAEVVYGDTDSNYCSYPDEMSREECLRTAQDICEELTNDIYPYLAEEEFGIPAEDNRWNIEIEMFAPRMFQSGSQKHYAYIESWEEGMPLDESMDHPEFSVSGYHCVKSNHAMLTKNTQEAVLEAICRNESDDKIREIIFDATDEIDPENPDWQNIGIPGGLGKKLGDSPTGRDEYYTWTNGTPKSAQPRAAYFANNLLDVNFEKDSKPMRVYLKEKSMNVGGEAVGVDVIAYDYPSDLEPIEGEIAVDVQKMQTTLLRNPMEDIMSAAGMDIDAALAGQQQQGLGAFC